MLLRHLILSLCPAFSSSRLAVVCLQRAYDPGRPGKPHSHRSPNGHPGVCRYRIPSADCVLEQIRWERPGGGVDCAVLISHVVYVWLRNCAAASWATIAVCGHARGNLVRVIRALCPCVFVRPSQRGFDPLCIVLCTCVHRIHLLQWSI